METIAPIITVTTNASGIIFNNSYGSDNLFKNCNNIYDIENLNRFKSFLCGNFKSKKLLVNLLKHNYSVYKLPLQINGIGLYQYIFEEWRMNNISFSNNIKHKINSDLCNIDNYTTIEREIIYSLFCGFIQDKEIYHFLKQFNWHPKAESNIKYTISLLFEKFGVNNRSLLLQSLKIHNLDKYLPETLFTPGIYDGLLCQINR